jgi:hypothetical protein
MIIKSSSAFLACAAILFVTAGCWGLNGTFAYKTLEMDSYRTMYDNMEFAADSPVDWVFKFSSSGKKRIGVILVKHELVWAEVRKDTQEIEKEKPQVWGKIEGLSPGEYKIMITYNNDLVAEKPFIIYDPADLDE